MKKAMKIFGLMLSIMLVVSMLIPGTASAAYGNQTWQAQPMPSNTSFVLNANTDMTDIAIGSGVIYAIDGQTSTTVTGAVYKSTDGGTSWTMATDPVAGLTMNRIAVAPDNTNVIAVSGVVGAAYKFFISTDAGSTWTDLTTTALPATAVITGISIAPARSGTLLGREYFISVADSTAGTLAGVAGIYSIGVNSTFTAIGVTVDEAGLDFDWMAVAVTPNFLGDRSIVALGVSSIGSTIQVKVINTNGSGTVTSAANLTIAATTKDLGGAIPVVKGTIALPTDFDASNSSGRKGYVSLAANPVQNDNDVYRFDDTVSKALAGGIGAWSLSYSGTTSSGTLFEGKYASPNILYTNEPNASSPTWITNARYYQPGFVAPPMIVVGVAADYATSKTVYVGSSGLESAFSVSKNGGLSFNQKSQLDIAGNTISSISGGMSFDGKTVYIATKNVNYGVWTSPMPSTDTSWTRIFAMAPAVGGTKIGFANVTSDVFVVTETDGVTPPNAYNVWRSTDAGNTWSSRLAPVGTQLTDGWQDANVGYWVDSSNNILRTTNGGYTWGAGVATGLTGINQLSIPSADNLIISATGAIALSKDGGQTFTKYNLDPTINYRVTRDPAYATNNIIYLADRAGAGVYKYQIGTDPKVVDLSAPVAGATAGVALNIRSGVMYVLRDTATLRVDRSVNFTNIPGTITWDDMGAGAPAAAGSSGTSINDNGTVFFAKVGIVIYAYADTVGSTKPVISAPKDNYSLIVDPNTGVGKVFSVSVNSIGSGTGLANQFEVGVTEKAVGWDAATIYGPVIVSNPTAPVINIGTGAVAVTLNPNTEYLVRVRVFNTVSNDFVHSPWSDPVTIAVQTGGRVIGTDYGITMTSPQGGATTGTMPGFTWNAVFGATKYQVKVATDAALTKLVAGTPADVTGPSFQVTTALTPGVYFWSVQATAPTAGPVAIGSFTVAAPTGTATQPAISIAPIVIPTPTFILPTQPAAPVTVVVPPPAPAATPAYVWLIIVIGAVLVIAVIVLIVRTRKTV